MHLSHTISRRSVLTLLFAIVAIVLGGMTWATHTTLQLDAERRKSEQREAYESTITLAMYRLDVIEARVRQENELSFDVFKQYYRPPRAFDPATGAEKTEPLLIPSPLLTLSGPDGPLLHFMAMAPDAWDSPQVGRREPLARPVSEIPYSKRTERATAANWFASLRSNYEPAKLEQLADEAIISYYERGAEPGIVAPIPKAEAASSDAEGDHSQAVTEFEHRREQSQDRVRQLRTEVCEKQAVILANLIPGQDNILDMDLSEECQPVYGSLMAPVWLDVAADGHLQLAMMRTIALPYTDYSEPTCVVQGVLFDWDRLRTEMETSVQELLPGARIVRVANETPPSIRRLHTIPAELVAEMPTSMKLASTSYDVVWGLTLAWVVLIAALSAIIYGTLKYLGLLERRMRFTAAVTHELRTPLTSFQLYTDLLSELPRDDHERRQKYLTTLRNESKRLSNLVENVLVYSRINDAAARVHPRSVKPKEILEALQEETARRCEDSHRSLVINDRTKRDSTLETDPEFVRQILASLVDNACKYSGTTGPIWIDATSTKGGGISFDVDDGGRGVDPYETRAIFEPFRRGRDADQQGGMGLGLALSRYWAACLDGRLTIKRSERNGGCYSRFSLDLPRRPRTA